MPDESLKERVAREAVQTAEYEAYARLLGARTKYGYGPIVDQAQQEWEEAREELEQYLRKHSDGKANQQEPTVHKGTADKTETKEQEPSHTDVMNKQGHADVDASSRASVSPSEFAQGVASSSEASQSPPSSPETSQNPPIQASTEQSIIEQPVSQRRADSNRRNALRSTGPKSQRGKDVAARNSLRHGLLAKSAVITRGPVKESQAEFDELLRGLHDYFAPVGTAEELLVQEIAICYWMERRAQLYENAQICKEAWPRTPEPEPERKPWKELGYDKGDEDDKWIRNLLNNSQGYRLLRYPEGVQYVLGIVDRFKKEVDNKDGWDADLLEKMADICGGYWETVDSKRSYVKSALLAELDKEKGRLELLKKKLEENPPRSRRRPPDFSHTALLLAPEKLDLVQRYTAAHEKRRYRALAQLERLQRQRSGEPVPSPINVQVTGDAGDFAKRSQ